MGKLTKEDIKDLQELLVFGMFNCGYALNKKVKELKKDKPYLFKYIVELKTGSCKIKTIEGVK